MADGANKEQCLPPAAGKSIIAKGRIPEKDVMLTRGVDCMVIVPTEVDGKVVGFISIENPGFHNKGYREQIPALMILSELTGMAIQHKSFLANLSLFKNLINESNDFIFGHRPASGGYHRR